MPIGTETKNNNQTLAACLINSGLAFKETELNLKINGRDPLEVHTAGISDKLPGAHKYSCTHITRNTHVLAFPVPYLHTYVYQKVFAL